MRPERQITDTTAIALRGAPNALLAPFIGLALGTGLSSAEVWPEQFERLASEAFAGSLLVRVADKKEYNRLQALGAPAFVAEADAFCANFGEGEYPDLTVEFQVGTAAGALPADGQALGRRAGALRVSGLSDVMAGDYRVTFEKLRGAFGPGLSFRAGNRRFCATAASLEWILSGGRACCAAFGGAGDAAFLEEVLAGLNVLTGADYRLSGMPRLRAAYERAAKRKIVNFKPVAGREIFAVESGIHADGIFKNPANYEPFTPESVGGRRRLVIGKHSGRGAVQMKLYELGLPADDELVARLNEAVRTVSIKERRSLRDDEVRRLCLTLCGEGGETL